MITIFPEIRDEVLDECYQGLLTLQIGCFKRFTQRAIDRNDLITIKKCFDFVDEDFEAVEFKVENSLAISYLGKLNIVKDSKIEMLLSPKLKDIRTTLASYYESILKDEKFAKFLKDLE